MAASCTRCTIFTCLSLLYTGIATVNGNTVPLMSTCTRSVQCTGIAVCINGLCQCPPPYKAFGTACVQSGHENDLALDLDKSRLLSWDSDSIDRSHDSVQSSIPSFDRSIHPTDTSVKQDLIISSSSDEEPFFMDTMAASTRPLFLGFPGQSCGKRNECRGNSFCYKGICSCHQGAIVSGRTCALIRRKFESTTASTAIQGKKAIISTPIVRSKCPLHSFWRDGECVTGDSDLPSVTENSLLPDSNSTHNVVIDNGRGVNVSQSSAAGNIDCSPPSFAIGHRCIAPPNFNMAPPFVTPLASFPMGTSDIRGADLSLAVASFASSTRCPPGEVLINSVCLPAAMVVNYPSALLCTVASDCPGESTCSSYFCICTAPLVWHPKSGCHAPPVDSITVPTLSLPRSLPREDTQLD